jgi:hypothetical protein
MAAVLPSLAASAADAPVVAAPGTAVGYVASGDSSRYHFYNGYWWYWTPDNRWLRYVNGQWVAPGVPADSQGYKTIEELFAAYKKAQENHDWKKLFLLGTPERQDSEILSLVISAATSNDVALKNLVEKHGANWKQFDHEWTDGDRQRLMREFPSLAASIGKQVRNKPELMAAAEGYIYKKGDPWSTQVHQLTNLVRHGTTAEGVSFESQTSTVRSYDAQGNKTGQASQTSPRSSRLWFRQIDRRWYLATENEITPEK